MFEKIAYAITRGAVRAWLDVMQEGRKAVDEVPAKEDHAIGDYMLDAINRVREQDDIPTEKINPSPDLTAVYRQDLGEA
jgi:hypothetical protein